MKAHELPEKERRRLQVITIIAVLALVYLFFIRQQIITAMIVGAVLLGAQRAYLHFRKG